MTKQFFSNGKLLITGEYAVLDGALALAIPTLFGQALTVIACEKPGLFWTSYDVDDQIWYDGHFSLEDDKLKPLHHNRTSNTLHSMLQKARQLNPEFLREDIGLSVTTRLEFPNYWGLGSSSTLINNIAQWAGVDAFQLLEESFGGSGYDIAAAQHDLPILYERTDAAPIVKEIELPWTFTERLYFVHLNQKQDSKKGIERYRAKKSIGQEIITKINELTRLVVASDSLEDFKKHLEAHEQIIATLIGLPKIKDALFPDFNGLVKSLGAWGGDFVLVTGAREDMAYFEDKGFHTIIPFSEMIK